jgi:uncharacterized SAM-binding protein YcdF (DUF218 family)
MNSIFFILSKLFSFIFEPLVWFTGIIIYVIRTKNQQRKRKWIWILGLVIYLFSNGFIYNEVMRLYEPELVTLEDKEHFGVVIVPGGFAQSESGTGRTQFYEAADRFNQALWLYKTQKADKILITGGSGSFFLNEEKEALAVKRYLRQIGIPDSAILVEYNSKNTHQNAILSKQLVDSLKIEGPFILCTSALHMPRAFCTFRKAGWRIKAFPTNKNSKMKRDFSPYNLLLPKSQTLADWSLLFKEWIGLLMYKITGKC